MDYSEILMQSMDVFVSKRLSELQFDKTIIVQIVDDTNAEHGEYEVTDGSTTFTAYSKDVTFKTDESVYVTIPNGNYDNQKQIIGKYVGDGESLTYLSPLDSYVDITGDLCNFTAGASLLANRVYDQKTDGPINYISQKVIWKTKIQNGKGFERLGVQADFKTWLKKLKVNSGNFGLCLYVTYIEKATVNSEDLTKVKAFVLDSDSMYGNPYNFESFYTQQKTFDLSEINGQITDMKLVFYQDYNFGTTTGDSAATKDKNGNWLIDNIYVNNVHISMGYDIAKFDKDTVLVYTTNESTYNYNNLTQENHKVLQTRWVRCTKEGIYAIDAADEIPENASIHWYKYQIKIQDEVDELAGPFWFENKEGLNKLQIEVDPDVNEISQLYKVVIEVPSRQWIENQLDEEMNAEYKELVFQSTNPALSTEDLEEAISQLEIYEDNINSQRQIIASEPIEFKSEVPVIDKMTVDLINGLEIIVDEKGYKGNYLLYNLSNQIQNANESTKLRILKATYKSLVTGEQTLDGAESIIWKIPLTNTMIYPPEDGKEYSSSDKVTSYWVENGYAYIKRMSGNSNSGGMGTVNDWSCEQKFRIKDYYQESATNNIVYCYVVKNNIAYEASAELYFGPMSSNGTDFTFKMGFESDVAAVTRETPQVLRVNFQMFDFNNDKVPNFWDNGITVEWYSKSGDEIYFCDATGNISKDSSEFTFLDGVGRKITDGQTIPTKVVIKANHFYIKYKGTVDVVPNYYVAQAFVTTDPTIGAGAAQANHVRLSCQLLIPYRDNKKYAGIEGATHILYSSSGTSLEFYDGKYRLWRNEGNDRVEETGITWRVYPIFSALYQPYFPKMGEGTKLIVPSTYVEGLSTQICVQAIGQNEKVLWSHPIVMMKDAYSSAMLNAWDGNLTIDNKNGTILSTMIGAGKKENDNSYSGVLMGDVKCALDDITKIGLYGFNFGLQSFGWTIDGKGFIGKAGQGQILFDGNKGTISSGVWRTSQGKIGMEIDLDGPTGQNAVSTGSTFKMKGLAGTISFDTSAQTTATELFVVQGRLPDNNDFTNPVYNANIQTNNETKEVSINNTDQLKYKDLIKIAIDTRSSDGANGTHAIAQQSSFYIQSLNFNATENAATGVKKSGTRLDLHNGKFISYGTCGRVEIATSSNTFFRLADGGNNILFMIKSVDDDEDGSGTASQYYLQSSTFNATAGIGTRLDLQHGKYTSYGSQGKIVIDSSANAMFTIDHRSGNDYTNLMTIGGEGYWLKSVNYGKAGKTDGSKWDLNSGKFESYNTGGKILIQPNDSTALFVVKDSSDNYLMRVGSGSGNYFLQSGDFNDSTKGVKFDLSTGKITAYNFQIKAFGSGGNIVIDSSAEFPLNINNGKFTVKWDGTTNIAGSLTVNGATTLNSTLTVSGGNGCIKSGGGDYYSLNKNGATIGGWSISTSSIKSASDATILYSNGQIHITHSGGGYFQMGGATAHPRVSGLNVGSNGINFNDGAGHGIGDGRFSGDWNCTGTLTADSEIKATGQIHTDTYFSVAGSTTNLGPNFFDAVGLGRGSASADTVLWLTDGFNRKGLHFRYGIYVGCVDEDMNPFD